MKLTKSQTVAVAIFISAVTSDTLEGTRHLYETHALNFADWKATIMVIGAILCRSVVAELSGKAVGLGQTNSTPPGEGGG